MFSGIVLITCLVGAAFSSCPHDAGYRRWSSTAAWGGNKPAAGSNVLIADAVMVDEATPDFYNVTIAASGALTFDPEVAIEFRAANILVFGRLEIGSKNCPYPGDLTITLTGTREIHTGETNPKAILRDPRFGNTTSEGIGAYTMSADGTVKRWGLYHLKRDGQELADHMN
ncbi:PKHL1-like protein, partial [Mya arenaria]